LLNELPRTAAGKVRKDQLRRCSPVDSGQRGCDLIDFRKDHLVQHLAHPLHSLGLDARRIPGGDLRSAFLRLLTQVAPALRGDDQLVSPVVRIGGPRDESATLQLVDEGNDLAGVETDIVGDLALGDADGFVTHHRQHAVCPHLEPMWCQCLVAGFDDLRARPSQQEAQIVLECPPSAHRTPSVKAILPSPNH
jgi:hypothetical protein